MSYIVGRVLDAAQGGAGGAGARHGAAASGSQPPFPRISYTDAVARLNQLGSDIKWGDDLGGDDETLLAKQYDRPVFVFNYPKGVKAFYMKENPDDPRTVLNNDCLAPEGYGEIIGGSQREDDYDKLLARIHEQGLDPEAYRWYLDLRKYGTFVHSGFGLGVERRWPGSAGFRTFGKRSRFPGRSIGCIRRPANDSLVSPRPTARPAPADLPCRRRCPARRQPLDAPRTGPGTCDWRASRAPRLHAGLAGKVDHGESRSPISPTSRRWAVRRVGRRSARCRPPAPFLHLGQLPRGPSRSAPRRRASRTPSTPRAPAAGRP